MSSLKVSRARRGGNEGSYVSAKLWRGSQGSDVPLTLFDPGIQGGFLFHTRRNQPSDGGILERVAVAIVGHSARQLNGEGNEEQK